MKKDSAMNFLIIDLLKNILSLAEKPEKLGQYITNQIRELVGSKMVMLLSHNEKPEDANHMIIGICPERNRSKPELRYIKRIADLSHPFHQATIVHHAINGNELENVFYLMGGHVSVIVPLEYAANRIGLLILYDLIDLQNIESVIDSLNTLSGVLALELRNAMYYNNLEWKVAERTKELRESEENWRTMGIALKKKAEELERTNNLMLGREMKMIELKKEVNELLKKTGEKEKYRIHE